MHDTNLDFPRTFELIGRPKFEEMFMEELQDQESELDLGRYCERGGFPDPESVELELESVTPTDQGCVVRVKCKFDEAVATSCADVRFDHPALVMFDVALDVKTETAHVKYQAA
jgi:hypothetical protein